MSRHDYCLMWVWLFATVAAIALIAVYDNKSSPTPAPGTPASGPPAPGTPAPGTPAPGTPAPGTPAPETPAPRPSGPDEFICNSINLHQGVATITDYDARASGGSFGVNNNVPSTYFGAAVPYAWYNTTSGNNNAYGNCPGGITGAQGYMPMHNGTTLCYTLTNPSSSKTLNIMVTETCGGNCQPNDKDCATLGALQYVHSKRDYPHQLCPKPPNNFPNGNMWGHITGSGAPNVSYATTKSTCENVSALKDWCSGYYAHFDIAQSAKWGNGIVKYARISCPAS